MRTISLDFNIQKTEAVKNLVAVLGYLRGKKISVKKYIKGEIPQNALRYLNELRKENDLPSNNDLDPETIKLLNQLFITKKYQDPVYIEVLHTWLVTLDYAIAEAEIAEKKYGETTTQAIQQAQEKYKLDTAGQMTVDVEGRLETAYNARISRAKPTPALLKVNDASRLRRIVSSLNLNNTGTRVQALQLGLAWLGYEVQADEYKNEIFGKYTRLAVIAYQKANDLPAFGHVTVETASLLNKQLGVSNPSILDSTTYRVRGAIREADWKGVDGAKVQVFEHKLRGEPILLGEKSTLDNGFYDLIYTPPTNPKNNKAKENFHILVRLVNPNTKSFKELVFFNASKVVWANFTDGKIDYQGKSIFETNLEKITCALEEVTIDKIEESEKLRDFTFLYQETGMPMHNIMELSLAHRIADGYFAKYSAITPAVVYSFLRLRLPNSLPTYLMPDTLREWHQWIKILVEKTAIDLALLPKELQADILDNAVERNVLPIQTALEVEKAKESLSKVHDTFALEKPLIANSLSLDNVLQGIKLSGEQRLTISREFANEQDFSRSFISSLQEKEVLSADQTKQLEDQLYLAEIALFDPKNIERLKATFTTKEILAKTRLKSDAPAPILAVRDFAKWTEQHWIDFVKAGEPKTGGIKAAKRASIEKKVVLKKEPAPLSNIVIEDEIIMKARQMRLASEAIAPEIAVTAAVKRNNNNTLSSIDTLVTLMDDKVDLDLRHNHLDSYIKDNSLALDEQATEDLKTLQRVVRIAPNADVAAILIDNNINSAHQAQQLGAGKLNALFSGNNLAGNLGVQVYNTAVNQVTLSTGLQAIYSNAFNNVNPQAIINLTGQNPAISNVINGIPDLENLFGTGDYCECKHCRSVYSPAAYLTDVIQWLNGLDAVTSGLSARDILFQRRSDLQHIDLNCENTNTPLPYIDLVCEILEQAISNDPAFEARNTTWTAAELKAKPQYVQESVYNMLANLNKPYGSHSAFSLWQTEAHAYLEKLGSPYSHIVETLKQGSADDYALACAYFKIPTNEATAITVSMTDVNLLSWTPDPAVGRNVKTFLHDHQLSYAELVELLQCAYINPTTSITINRPIGSCNLAAQELMGLGATELDKIWRFLRLLKYTGWTITELDLAIAHSKVGQNDLSVASLVNIYHFHRIQQELDLPVNQCLSFYGTMDVRERRNASNELIPSLYEAVYLNPLLDDSVRGNFEIAAVTTATTSLSTGNAALMAYIANAVGADLGTVKSLVSAYAGSGILQLEVLSAVYRRVQLAKKLNTTDENLLDTIALTTTNPFLNLSSTTTFMKHYEVIKASGMTVEDIRYLISNTNLDAHITDATSDQWNSDLSDTLQAAYDGLFSTNYPAKDLLELHLSKISYFEDAVALSDMVALVIDQTWAGSASDRDTFIENAFDGIVTDYQLNELKVNLGTINATPTGLNSRVQLILEVLHWYINKPLVVDFVADEFDITRAAAEYILALKPSTTANSYLLAEILFKGTTLSGPRKVVHRYIHKIVFIMQQWNWSIAELDGFIQYHADLNTMNIQRIPADASMTPLAYVDWYNTWQYTTWIQQPGYGTAEDFFAMVQDVVGIGSATLATVQQQLANWAGWSFNTIVTLHGHYSLGTALATYIDINKLLLLKNSIELLNSIPAPVAEVLGWKDINTIANHQLISQQIQTALRVKLGDNQWLKVQPTIQDQIRIQKRDALVAYSTKYDSAGNEVEYSLEDLFNYHLIDPGMSSCQLTSRIKQAISSTQLFVQRCRMSLEKAHVVVESTNAYLWDQWKWMQNYRVWEANRKVFLYPENWIEPALRDDKSEFFEALEDELLQNDVTDENVTRVFNNYLQKVHEVANMDMVGMCTSFEEGEMVIHVVGKTKENPAIYYYRKRKNNIWTAWQKIDIEIKGEHVVPYVFNGKIHLFWLEILERPMEQVKLPVAKDKDDGSTFNPEMNKYKEIQLGWTWLRADGRNWNPKKVSKRKLIHPWPRPHYSLHLRPRMKTSDLWLDVYVSTSKEFNDTPFYNQFEDNYEYMTSQRFDENQKPWHSSSFVFDGYVRQIKLFGISGNYWFINIDSVFTTTSVPVTSLSPTGSLYIDNVTDGSDWPDTEFVTNYGRYHADDSSEMAALNHKINETKHSSIPYHIQIRQVIMVPVPPNMVPVLQIELRLPPYPGFPTYAYRLPEKLNNYLASGDEDLLYARPEETTTTTVVNYHLPQVLEKTAKELYSDSFNYIYSSFGDEGRMLEKMSGDERADHFESPSTLHFKNNYLTGKKVHPPVNTGALSYLLNNYQDQSILSDTPSDFKVFYPMEETRYGKTRMNRSLYQDEFRSYYVSYENDNQTGNTWKYRFYPMYHPYTRRFTQLLNSQGVDGLLNRDVQVNASNSFNFSATYPHSTSVVCTAENIDTDVVDFTLKGTYATYNWEIFFHIPLMIATHLSNNQRFEEAMKWFHFIFNPTGVDENSTQNSPTSHFWITKPFYEFNAGDYQAQQIQNMLGGVLSDETKEAIRIWKNNPFNPHSVARYRPVAFQRAVVMKYIDNLIDWGDQLFRRETLESLNQASLMYIIAHEILGKRPESVTGTAVEDKTYDELSSVGQLDDFSNKDVELLVEGLIGFSAPVNNIMPLIATPIMLRTKYFCIPKNDKLLKYWDLVADRLFKIRNCMNIDGVVRQLPLFAPPIDPALLVNAVAVGVDLNSAINNLNPPNRTYKYRTLVRLASQFTGEVKSLGQSLLSALQARDSEGMALLQSSNALKLLDATTRLKEMQIDEAKENISSLEISKEMATYRKDFYEGRVFMNSEEKSSFKLSELALDLNRGAANIDTLLSVIALIPDFKIGVQGLASSPVGDATWGATNLYRALQAVSDGMKRYAAIHSQESGLLSTMGGYKRRQEDWDMQAELAIKEIEQIDKQIAAAKIRVAIAEKDLDNHRIQIDNAKSEEAYLKTKYTNKQLYSWMIKELSKTYRQAYDLAFHMAKQAEKSFQYELSIPDTSFIEFGYWDNLKEGLLSGDKLLLGINKMEAAYVEKHKRDYELTKQISLRLLDPSALLSLKLTGSCTLEIPEWWFDLDYPGHYMRRIKAISVSIPCIVGPNTNVSCTLTMTKNTVRPNSEIASGSYTHANNYTDEYGKVESIALSNGQNDSGVFELNFNDERYLPFEGAGVISNWTLSLPPIAQFDYSTITDVVIHMRYMAREGGSSLAGDATTATQAILNTAMAQTPPLIMLSAKQAFSTQWHRFLYPDNGTTVHKLEMDLEERHYPYISRFSTSRKILDGEVWLEMKAPVVAETKFTLKLTHSDFSSDSYQAVLTVGANATSGTIDLVDFEKLSTAIPPAPLVPKIGLFPNASSVLTDLSKWTIECTQIETGTPVVAVVPFTPILLEVDDLYLVLKYKS